MGRCVLKEKRKMLFHHLKAFLWVVDEVVDLLDAFFAALLVVLVPSHRNAVRNVFLLFELLQGPKKL